MAETGESGTLNGCSGNPFHGDGDQVTLFLGVLMLGLLTEGPEGVLTGVLRMPFSGLFFGVSSTKLFETGDLNGLPLRTILLSPTAEPGLLRTKQFWALGEERGVLGFLLPAEPS